MQRTWFVLCSFTQTSSGETGPPTLLQEVLKIRLNRTCLCLMFIEGRRNLVHCLWWHVIELDAGGEGLRLLTLPGALFRGVCVHRICR